MPQAVVIHTMESISVSTDFSQMIMKQNFLEIRSSRHPIHLVQ